MLDKDNQFKEFLQISIKHIHMVLVNMYKINILNTNHVILNLKMDYYQEIKVHQRIAKEL